MNIISPILWGSHDGPYSFWTLRQKIPEITHNNEILIIVFNVLSPKYRMNVITPHVWSDECYYTTCILKHYTRMVNVR